MSDPVQEIEQSGKTLEDAIAAALQAMRAERDETAAEAGANTEHVADFVHLHVAETGLAKTVGQPCAARRLAKGRRGNLRRFHLPKRILRLACAEALEGGADVRQTGNSLHFPLHGRR